ncbi:hypothetical protein HNV12_19205 [Methanococcoides sp. SA1]|nr:hypothetical protein [Methanococcoides sp. SA1]
MCMFTVIGSIMLLIQKITTTVACKGYGMLELSEVKVSRQFLGEKEG